jgi:hypothetical protein
MCGRRESESSKRGGRETGRNFNYSMNCMEMGSAILPKIII